MTKRLPKQIGNKRGLAQMVEHVLNMHEVPGAMPGSSTLIFVFFEG